MARKKIKFEEEAISVILVADTDSEWGAESSDVDDFEEKEEEKQQQQQQQQQPSAEVKPQAATSGGLPTWGLLQGRNTNIHPFVCPAKGVEKSEAPHINKDSSLVSVSILFFTEIFLLLVEQTNVYYQQHLDRPSCRQPDIMLLDMMTFVALALQMEQELKDTLHD